MMMAMRITQDHPLPNGKSDNAVDAQEKCFSTMIAMIQFSSTIEIAALRGFAAHGILAVSWLLMAVTASNAQPPAMGDFAWNVASSTPQEAPWQLLRLPATILPESSSTSAPSLAANQTEFVPLRLPRQEAETGAAARPDPSLFTDLPLAIPSVQLMNWVDYRAGATANSIPFGVSQTSDSQTNDTPEIVPDPFGKLSPTPLDVPDPIQRIPMADEVDASADLGFGNEPSLLRDPLPPADLPVNTFAPQEENASVRTGPLLNWQLHAPLGYTGPSSVIPRESQSDSHFVPVEDRWRLGFADWDRYEKGFPLGEDYPYKKGHWLDPYNQNVLKGDYPIIGQHTFFNLTITNLTTFQGQEVPTATTPFESTLHPNQSEFFGDNDQSVYFHPIFFSLELFHGDAGFKPFDWMVRLTPVVNWNVLNVDELAVINPDVRQGTLRDKDDVALEEWFVETKLADLGPHYDFVSLRAGSQKFVSDFRGFIFLDTNRAVRLFGTRLANRDQFNVIWFDQQEKETNSRLNTFDDRHQNVFIANYFRQDCIWPGYTSQLSFHSNQDKESTKFDKNNVLVRPDPAGVFRPHRVDAYYFGWSGDGHINRYNISHSFYWAVGEDSLNPIAGKDQNINAQMAAVELSYDRDYVRFRSSFFWSSGDDDVNDGQAEGFDSILDNPNFAGGVFSFWQRQAIQLFGVRLVNDGSLIPDLRSSRIQGQSNFVNPGLFLANVGMDADLTPKLKLITNANYLWFDNTQVLEFFTFQDNIHNEIGMDLSLGVEYRPLLNDNLEILFGVSALVPGAGFDDLYSPLRGEVDTLAAAFLELVAIY